MKKGTLRDALKVLLDMKNQPHEVQVRHRDDLNQAFDYLLTRAPTESEFTSYTSGLVFTPEMLYMIWTMPPPADARFEEMESG